MWMCWAYYQPTYMANSEAKTLLRQGHISHNACENLLNLNKKNQEIMSQVMYL